MAETQAPEAPEKPAAGMPHEEKVLHLLRRLRFGTTKKEFDSYAKKSLAEIVDEHLSPYIIEPRPPKDRDDSKQTDLQMWWYRQMIGSARPFVEKMTLFWHSHFTSAFATVNTPAHMAIQNEMLRENALGNFKEFAYAASIDLAMLYWLNNDANVKDHPNENYAREFMELFTLGRGNYTEKDVREVARAFTGWTTNGEKNTVSFSANRFDPADKTILEKTAAFGMREATDWIVSQDACPLFIVNKLWKKFVSPKPSKDAAARLAKTFVDANYELRPLLREMFLCEEFYSAAAAHSIVKDPVEYVVEMCDRVNKFEFKRDHVWSVAQMGMKLFDPPNVSGWQEGLPWLSTDRIFARGRFANWVASAVDADCLEIDWKDSEQKIVSDVLDKLGLFDVSDNTKTQLFDYANVSKGGNDMLKGLVYLCFVSPEAQVK